MNRLAASAFASMTIALLGCATAPPRPAITDLPPGCVGIVAENFTIQVDHDGNATPECLGVYKGVTKLVWKGPSDARRLLAIFERATPPAPVDPSCTGRNCTLDRGRTRVEGTTDRTFKYSLVLVRSDGSVVAVDPKLIIKP